MVPLFAEWSTILMPKIPIDVCSYFLYCYVMFGP